MYLELLIHMANLFICGKSGSGKTFFAHRYAKDNLINIPFMGSGWSKDYKVIKRAITEDTVFLWDLFEHTHEATLDRLPKLDTLRPNHQHIICSIFPPSHYSKEVQDFLIKKNFHVIHLNGDENTPVETVVKNIDKLIDSLYFFM